jgi:hypothetical protein
VLRLHCLHVEPIERQIAGEIDVELAKFDGRADIDQIDR